MSRAILALLAAGLMAACAPRETAPRVVTAAPGADAGRASAPRDYSSTLASIVDRFEHDLSLPRVEVTLQLYPSRQQFMQGLIESGYSRPLARQAASSFHAIGGARTMLINESQLSQYPWDQRVRLLAHEVAHSVQYRLAGGVRGVSEQWLREGFADYVSIRIASAMGYGSVARQRDAVLAPLGNVPVGTKHAPLPYLRTFTQWVGAQVRFDVPVYTQAFVAAEFLIDGKGLEPTLRYFEMSRPGADPDATFTKAFGMTLAHFEQTFALRWMRVLNERGVRDSD